MRANARVIGIVLLAAPVAVAGTSFGAVAVPEGHPAAEASEHEHAEVEVAPSDAQQEPQRLEGRGVAQAAPLARDRRSGRGAGGRSPIRRG